MATTGENIKKLRESAGLNQAELGEKAFDKPAQAVQAKISRIENNPQRPSFKELTKIAKALDLEVEDLLGDEQPTQPQRQASGVTLSPALVTMFPAISNYIESINSMAEIGNFEMVIVLLEKIHLDIKKAYDERSIK